MLEDFTPCIAARDQQDRQDPLHNEKFAHRI